MAPTTIRLAHPELCEMCADLLPTGTVVLVDPSLHVTCAGCADLQVGHRPVDPWAFIDDPVLRDRLVHRHDGDRELAVA